MILQKIKEKALSAIRKPIEWIDIKMESFERKADPYVLIARERAKKFASRVGKWLYEQYRSNVEAQEKIWKNFEKKMGEYYRKKYEKKEISPLEKKIADKLTKITTGVVAGFTIPPITGMKKLDPRVARVLQKAIQKGVSPKTIQKIIKINPKKLTPYYGNIVKRFREMTPPKINLERIRAPEEIKKSIIDWTNKNAQYLTEKYPHYTFQEIESELQKTGLNIDEALKNLKKVFGNDTKKILISLKGVRDYALNIQKEISSLQHQIKVATNPDDIITLTAKLKEKQLLADALWEAVAGSGRVAGQYLGFRKQIAQALKGTVVERREILEKLVGRSLDPKSEAYQTFVRAIKSLDPDDPYQILKFLREAQAPNIFDFPASIWYNSVLSGPSTYVVNFLGNSLFGTVESGWVRPVSFLLDTPISKIRKVEPTYTSKSLIGYYGGALRGIRNGAYKFFKILKTGVDPEELINPSKWTQLRMSPWEAKYVKIKIPLVKTEKIIKVPERARKFLIPFGKIIDIPTRLLKATDAFFKGIFEEARKFELAVPKVWKEGKTLRQILLEAERLARTDPDIAEKAVQFGRWVTFQDAPGKVTQWVIRGRDTIPGFRYVVPFVNIASNLFKRGFFDYAPPGLAKGIYQIIVKDPKGAETAARGMFGTILMLLGAIKYLEGDLILEPPRTKAERDAFYRQGKQPWSVKFGDRYVGIRRVEPFIYPFISGALLVDSYIKAKINKAKFHELIFSTAQKLGEFATDATYLFGLNQLWEAFNSPWDEKGEQFMEWIINVGVSYLPFRRALWSIVRSLNPEVPEPTPLERFKAMIPFLSKKARKRLTVWGEPAKYVTGAKGAFLPVASSEITKDPVETELERLDLIIGFPSRTIQGKRLDDTTYRIYLKISGRLSRLAIELSLIHI